MSTKILVLLGVLVAAGLVVLVVVCAARPARTARARDRRSAGSPVAAEHCRPHMPEVDRLAPERLESVFQLAFTKPSSSGLVIVTPGRLLMELPTKSPAPDLADSAKEAGIQPVRRRSQSPCPGDQLHGAGRADG